MPPQPIHVPAGLRRYATLVRGRRWLAFDRWLVRNLGVSAVTWQYAVSRGDRYQPTLLLTTTGARTGRDRSVALPYFMDGASYVVVASNGGGPRDPQWLRNLEADPACTVRVRRRDVRATASISRVDDDQRLYDLAVAERPVIADYRTRVAAHGRRLPLVRLTPRGG